MTGAETDTAVEDDDPAGEGRPGCVAAMLQGPWLAVPGSRRPPDHRPPGRRPPNRWDRGSATAEIAVALPVLVAMLAAGMMAVNATRIKAQCVSAAREAALSAARGESGTDAAREAAPAGASVSVSVDGDRARATVSASVRPFGKWFGGFTVDASSVAAVEPGMP